MDGYRRSILSLLFLTSSVLIPTVSVVGQTPRPRPQLPPNGLRTQFPIHLKNVPAEKAGAGVRILEAGTLSGAAPTASSKPFTTKDTTDSLGYAASSNNENGDEDDEMQVAADTLLYSRRSSYYNRPRPNPTTPITTTTTPFPEPLPTFQPRPPPPPPAPPRPPPPPPAPVGPPVPPTQVPILIPGDGTEEPEALPPAPPTSGGFPPSPPSGGRSAFAARQLPPIRRPVGGIVPKTNSVRNNLRTRATTTTTTTPDPNIITDYVFSDIKCFRTKQKEYFGAKIHMRSGFHLPYVRDRPEREMMSSQECHMDRAESPDTFQLKMTDLRACGVEQCGDSMCVTMVFPRLPLLALADDEVTTIKCVPQKSSISELRTISFAGDSLGDADVTSREGRRSGSTVEGGGQEFAAEVGVFRQSADTNNGLFVKRVNSGGVVQLGERLQLRSVVRGGDGWTFSRLTDVKVWRMRESYSNRMDEELDPKDAAEVITLVDGAGCRNSDYQVIAESDPVRDPRNDLVHHFTFKAFLFRGQRANEPLIVTAKVQACQERDDCQFVDCRNDEGNEREGGRYRRWVTESDELRNGSGKSYDWSSQLALRVMPLHDQSASSVPESPSSPRITSISETCVDKMAMSAFAGSFVMLLLGTLLLTLITFCRRGQRLQGLQKQLIDSATATTPAAPQPARSNPDYVRMPSDFVRTAAGCGEGTQLASLLQKIHSDRDSSGSQVGYRLETEAQGSTEDSVYIVYCPKVGGSRRAKSAPPSVTSQEAESEEDWARDEGGSRRTVRSVKRSQRRREEQGLRKGRRSVATGGSFPSRAKNGRGVSASKSVPEFERESRSRSVRLPRSNGYHFEQESPLSSEDMESAYFSSSASSHKGSTRSVKVETKECDKLSDIPPPLPPPNPKKRSDKPKPSTSHFVTRNETSTRILIIPETNV